MAVMDDNPGHTVVFVNWYGRADFRFHTYSKFGEPDPDSARIHARRRMAIQPALHARPVDQVIRPTSSTLR